MSEGKDFLKSASKESRKSKEFILLYTGHTGFKRRYQIMLLYLWECTVLYVIMFTLVIITTQAYWNVMSIFRAQLCSLTCYAGWKGIVGGRQLCLIISLMQQIMNQRRQSLTRDRWRHNTEVNRGSKSMFMKETTTMLHELSWQDCFILIPQ